MGRSSASVSSAFVSENAKSRDTLLRLEDEIIDKTYERAKIHNAQRRKGRPTPTTLHRANYI
jgi:hypothetical protein